MRQIPANVELLTRWVTRPRPHDVRVSRIQQSPDNPEAAAYVDLDSDLALGRATIWPELNADLLVLDAKSGQAIVNSHVKRVRFADLDRLLAATLSSADLISDQDLAKTRAAVVQIVSSYAQRGRVSPDDLVLAIRLVAGALTLKGAADESMTMPEVSRPKRTRPSTQRVRVGRAA
jgi:hypothetical protein